MSLDNQRLARHSALHHITLSDSAAHAALDQLVALASAAFRAPASRVLLFPPDEQPVMTHAMAWDDEVERSNPHALCRRVANSGAPLAIADVRTATGHVGAPPAAYLGIPLISSDGVLFGVCCVVDRAPRPWRPDEVELFQRLAAAAVMSIELAVDLAERRAVEQALRRSEERFRTVWEQASDAMALSDAAGVVLDANSAYYALYGYRAEEVLGQLFSIIFPPERRAWADEEYRAVFTMPEPDGPLPAFESTIQRKDGGVRNVETRIGFIRHDGERVALLSTIRDVTDRTEAEAERDRLLVQEHAARLEAQEAVRVRDGFLSVAAHELRTPLTSLLGHAQLVQRRLSKQGGLSERDSRALQVIAEQAIRLNRMISTLLDSAQLDRSGLRIQRRPLDLVWLARQVVEELRPTAADHTLMFSADGGPMLVSGDEVRLVQVLQNLVGNAIKYSPAGGEIGVDVGRRGAEAHVRVVDQGLGIPAEALPNLFRRFYRVESLQEQVSGMGLGLYIVHEIVALHGGRVEVESVEGQGSTFHVFLPLERDAEG